MKYRTCHEAYQCGIESRKAHPLNAGMYKLVESKDRIERIGQEIERISAVVRKVEPPSALVQCTMGDKAMWLRDVPLNVAHRLGYEIVPSLRALVFDGVPCTTAGNAAKFIQSEIAQHLCQWDGWRHSYRRKIANEYARMRNGGSSALDVVHDALYLINLAVQKLPASIQQQIE